MVSMHGTSLMMNDFTLYSPAQNSDFGQRQTHSDVVYCSAVVSTVTCKRMDSTTKSYKMASATGAIFMRNINHKTNEMGRH